MVEQEPTILETTSRTAEPPAPESPQPDSEPTQQAAETTPESTTETEPAEEAAPEARVVPKPSEYVLPEGVPDTVRIFAHEHDYTQEQLDAGLNFFNQVQQANQEQFANARRELGKAVVKNWGNEAATNKALALQASELIDNEIPGFFDYIKKTGAIDDPYMIQALHIVGRWGREGGFITTAVPRPPGKKTAAEAMYGDTHK